VVPGSPRHPTDGEPSKIFRYDQLWEFVSAIEEKRLARPSFYDGASAQVVADCALESSATRSLRLFIYIVVFSILLLKVFF
jgi:hypothetical protein